MRVNLAKVATGVVLVVSLLAAGTLARAQDNLLQAIPTPWGFDICGASCSGFYCCLIFPHP
jgi:hypothetical protein